LKRIFSVFFVFYTDNADIAGLNKTIMSNEISIQGGREDENKREIGSILCNCEIYKVAGIM